MMIFNYIMSEGKEKGNNPFIVHHSHYFKRKNTDKKEKDKKQKRKKGDELIKIE